jgi:hypothetical protein
MCKTKWGVQLIIIALKKEVIRGFFKEESKSERFPFVLQEANERT